MPLKKDKNKLLSILFIIIIIIGSYLIIDIGLYLFNINRKIEVSYNVINKINTDMKKLDDNIILINNIQSSNYDNKDLEELKKLFNEINDELNKEVLRIKDKKYTLIEYYDTFYNKNKTGSDEYNSLIKAKEKKIKSILGKYLKYDDNMYDLLKNDSYINLLEETINKKSAYYSIVKADYNYFKESNKYILSIYETTIKKYINLTNIVLELGR